MSGDFSSTVASDRLPSFSVLKARMATRSPGRSASTKASAARRMSPTSSRVEPEVSKSSATSKGASVVEKLAIFCGRPSSKIWKSEADSPVRGRPVLSVTTAGTETSCVSMRTTASSSTSTGAGGALFCGALEAGVAGVAGAGVGVGETRRGRWYVSSNTCARPAGACAPNSVSSATDAPSDIVLKLAGNFSTVLNSRV